MSKAGGTGRHRGADCREAVAELDFLCGNRRRTLYLAAQVEPVAVIRLGGRYAVGSQEHLLAAVLTVLGGFG